MMTIAQVSATFVAIVSGFFTSKVISIASDRDKIRSKLSELNTELTTRRAIAKPYKDKIDEIYKKRAKKTIDDLVDDLFEVELADYTYEQLEKKLAELNFDELTEYEKEELKARYPEISQKIKDELARKAKPTGNPLLDIRIPAIRGPVSFEITKVENDLLNELHVKFDGERNQILVLDAMLKQQEDELKRIVFPTHLMFGFISQIVFALTGVLFPLTYLSWSPSFPDNANLFGLTLFGVGLSLTFIYIGIELSAALNSKTSKMKKE